jgi:hypothetical protein
MSAVWRIGLLGVLATTLPATTLEQLSMDDLIQKSTGIVRATVTGTYTAARGANNFTFYRLRVSETWKGPTVQQMEVAVPGGSLRGVRQTVAGAPVLTTGQEYVLFLWTSRTGLTQVIGLSQGMFQLRSDASGNTVVTRAASGEAMVDRNGRLVEDQGTSSRLEDFRARVRGAVEK